MHIRQGRLLPFFFFFNSFLNCSRISGTAHPSRTEKEHPLHTEHSSVAPSVSGEGDLPARYTNLKKKKKKKHHIISRGNTTLPYLRYLPYVYVGIISYHQIISRATLNPQKHASRVSNALSLSTLLRSPFSFLSSASGDTAPDGGFGWRAFFKPPPPLSRLPLQVSDDVLVLNQPTCQRLISRA